MQIRRDSLRWLRDCRWCGGFGGQFRADRLAPLPIGTQIFRKLPVFRLSHDPARLVEIQCGQCPPVLCDLLLQCAQLLCGIRCFFRAQTGGKRIDRQRGGKGIDKRGQFMQNGILQQGSGDKSPRTVLRREIAIPTLEISSAAVFDRAHRTAAASATDKPGQHPDLPAGKRTCAIGKQSLYRVPQLPTDERCMRSLDTDPFRPVARAILLRFVRHAAISSLHHIADIHLVLENPADRAVLPEPSRLSRAGIRRCGDMAGVQTACDCRFAVSGCV